MENTTEKQLIDKWLRQHPLGACTVFRAKISTKSCGDLKTKNKKRLANYEYDNEIMGAFLKLCQECKGLRFD